MERPGGGGLTTLGLGSCFLGLCSGSLLRLRRGHSGSALLGNLEQSTVWLIAIAIINLERSAVWLIAIAIINGIQGIIERGLRSHIARLAGQTCRLRMVRHRARTKLWHREGSAIRIAPVAVVIVVIGRAIIIIVVIIIVRAIIVPTILTFVLSVHSGHKVTPG